MANSYKKLGCAMVALLGALSLSQAQTSSPQPAAGASPAAAVQPANPTAKANDNSPMMLVQAAGPSASPAATTTKTTTTTTEPETITESGGVGVREFQGDEIGQVLRLLARQAKINLVVSETVTGAVTM